MVPDKQTFTMKKAIAAIAYMLLSLFSCKGYKNLSVDEFKKTLSEDPTIQLVDVRTPAEYAEGHLAGAVNIDWFGKDFMDQAEAHLDKTRPVLVYCRSGRRSAAAAAALEKQGYSVSNMLGGYLAWCKAGK